MPEEKEKEDVLDPPIFFTSSVTFSNHNFMIKPKTLSILGGDSVIRCRACHDNKKSKNMHLFCICQKNNKESPLLVMNLSSTGIELNLLNQTLRACLRL